MVRASAIRLVPAIAALAAASCGTPAPEEPDFLRVVVDIDAQLEATDALDRFSIEVVRGTRVVSSTSYDMTVIKALPDSLIVYNAHPNNDSPEKQLESVPMLHVRLTAYKGAEVRLLNSFAYRFNAGKLQVALPMCSACLGKTDCVDGERCRKGKCVSESELTSAKEDGALMDALSECR